MEECLPNRKRVKKSLRAKHPDVVATRTEVETTYSKIIESGTSDNEKEWKLALQYLYNTYDRLNEEEITAKVNRIEEAHGDCK